MLKFRKRFVYICQEAKVSFKKNHQLLKQSFDFKRRNELPILRNVRGCMYRVDIGTRSCKPGHLEGGRALFDVMRKVLLTSKQDIMLFFVK